MSGMFSQLRYVQEQLAACGHAEWKEVSKSSDVPLGTVKRIGYKRTENPRSQAVDKIAAYFRVKEKRKS